jgi:hypothetical protein
MNSLEYIKEHEFTDVFTIIISRLCERLHANF